MAKSNGLGDLLFVGGRNLSGDVASINSLGGGPAVQEVPGINASAKERLGLQRDGVIDFATYFNDGAAANRAAGAGSTFVVLSALPTADVHLLYCRGQSIGNAGVGLVAKQADYKLSRPGDGSLGFSVQAQANGYGIEMGELLTAGLRTDVAATNGASIDYGAVSTLFGLSAYLQVTAFTGTDVTIKLQDSADNAAWADIASGGFTQITAANVAERIQTGLTATIRRYVRVITVTTGGFTSVSFAVSFNRHLTAVAY
ncbi:MAG: hypothetical protein HY873_12050 [Chloroflexi bacterium]|nr:hypothetical protein [Chloroflexota bacterium]